MQGFSISSTALSCNTMAQIMQHRFAAGETLISLFLSRPDELFWADGQLVAQR
jgi:hypothetical protein